MYHSAVLTPINVNHVSLYVCTSLYIYAWVYLHVLHKHVKLSCGLSPLHLVCGMWGGHSYSRCGGSLQAVGAAGTHSLQLCAGGLSCSCEYVCELECVVRDQFV